MMMRTLTKLNTLFLVICLFASVRVWADTQSDYDSGRSGAFSLYETSSSRTVSIGTGYRAVVPVSSYSFSSSVGDYPGSFSPVWVGSVSIQTGSNASAYSVKGTSSFVGIHADVAEVQAQTQSQHASGPKRIVRPTDPEIGVLPPDLPVGDAVLPLFLMLLLYAGCKLIHEHRHCKSRNK